MPAVRVARSRQEPPWKRADPPGAARSRQEPPGPEPPKQPQRPAHSRRPKNRLWGGTNCAKKGGAFWPPTRGPLRGKGGPWAGFLARKAVPFLGWVSDPPDLRGGVPPSPPGITQALRGMGSDVSRPGWFQMRKRLFRVLFWIQKC